MIGTETDQCSNWDSGKQDWDPRGYRMFGTFLKNIFKHYCILLHCYDNLNIAAIEVKNIHCLITPPPHQLPHQNPSFNPHYHTHSPTQSLLTPLPRNPRLQYPL